MNIQESPPTSPFRRLFNKNNANDSNMSNLSFDDYFEEKKRQILQLKIYRIWRENPLKIIYLIARFKLKLKKLVLPRIETASSKQISLIDDLCYFEEIDDRMKKSMIEMPSENEFLMKIVWYKLKRRIKRVMLKKS
jgi:hypothetical protein